MKRRVFSIAGIVLAFFGLIWFLQGADFLPGSVMTGSQFWEVAGLLAIIIGIGITVYCLKT
jgi:hypothetical protein